MENRVPSENKGHRGYFSIRENQLPLNLKEKLHVCGYSKQRVYGMNDVSEGEILLVLVL